jgi:hypothetical protein
VPRQGSTPFCNRDGECTGCLASADCGGVTPVCKDEKRCVECDRDEDCPADGGRRKCDDERCVLE